MKNLLNKIKEGLENLAIKGALKGASKACEKLIAKGKVLDLDNDDINDLQEGKDGVDNALESQKLCK